MEGNEKQLKTSHKLDHGNKMTKSDDILDACLSLTRPAAKLVAVERLLTNMSDVAQVLELWSTSAAKLEDQRDKRDCCLKILRMHASSVVLPRIVESWIKGFLSVVDPRLLYTFPEVTYNTLLCVLKDYDNIQRNLHVHCLIKVRPSEKDIFIPGWSGWKRRGKTENYPCYLERRLALKHRLFMFHPVILKAINSAMTKVPVLMAQLEKHRKLESLPMDEFMISLREDLAIAKSIFFVGFYNDVADLLRQPHSLNNLRGGGLKKFVRLLCLIIEVQATELMKRTIKDFLDILEDEEKIPKIDITLKVEYCCFILYPDEQEVMDYYHSYIIAVKNRFDDELPALEQYILGRSVIPPFVGIQLENNFYEMSEMRLRNILKNHFEELHKYVNAMDEVYGFLNRPEQVYNEIVFAASNMSYEPLTERRTTYQTYDDIFYGISVSRFDFFLCRLLQKDAIEYMRKKAIIYRDFYTSLIIHLYRKETERIVKTHEDIRTIAEATPVNPRFLVVTGKYMLALQPGDLMVALKERVLRNNEILGMLMGWIDLSDEERDFYTKGVMCYKEIVNTRKQYNKNYELHKSRFEDNLYNQSHVLSEKLEKMLPKIEIFSYMNELEKLEIYKEDIHNMAAVFKMHEDEIAEINEEEALLDIPISGFPEYDELRSSIYPMTKLITYVDLWKTMERKWIDGTFEDLDATDVELTSKNIEKMIKHYQKAIKDLITQQIEAGNPRRISGSVDDPSTLAGPLRICENVLVRIKKFNDKIIYISTLCNKSLKMSHWMEMKAITGLDLRPDSGTTLRKILMLNIGQHIERLQLISLGATEEAKLLGEFHESQSEFGNSVFQLVMNEEHGVMVLDRLDDTQVELDDHILKMQIISGSAFAKPYADSYKEWTDKLIRIRDCLEIWTKVQSLWLNLLPVFSSADVPVSLRKEKTLFKAVDSFVKNVIREITNNPSVVEIAGQPQLYKDSQLMYESLCSILSGMNDFMDETRLAFPRFYLLSNEEMMDVLSLSKEPLRLKPYLSKCFEGVSDVIFDDDMNVKCMVSREGEEVLLKTPFCVNEVKVEKWMSQFEQEMKNTLMQSMKESVEDYPMKERTEWLKCWPSEIVICVSRVFWTAEVTENFEKSIKWKIFESHLMQQLNELIAIVRESIPAALRKTVCSMTVVDFHLLDVAEETFTTDLTSLTDFQWLSRMRHYWDSDDLYIKVVHASLTYGYEYLGNISHLIMTPLTDRCFHTIMGAYHNNLYSSLGGLPESGKTETAKELSRILGVQYIVFNSCDSMRLSGMIKFFKGLALTGAWVCFDEFNRVEAPVVSVVAQHLLCISNALKEKATELDFDGTTIPFNPRCYICITLTNEKHDGNMELPENVKAFFRPVAMVVPDTGLVAEVSLISNGFSSARELAWKIVAFHSFCATQLSPQSHYTFGMRSIKETVCVAGNLKCKFPTLGEVDVVLQSIKAVNFCKLTEGDIPIYERIIAHLFPDADTHIVELELFEKIVSKVCLEMHYLPVSSFVEKIKQMYKVMNFHHAFIVVGEPFGGKTAALKVLRESLKRLDEESDIEKSVAFEVINPKSVTMEQLYGSMDSQSHDWTDGILPKTLRHFTLKETADWKWVIFDGPVDDSWVENLKTLLDNEKKLCLSTGEVIKLNEGMSVIFEAMNLSQASPAVVSRCGMIYMSPDSLGWSTLVDAWIHYNEDQWWFNHKKLLMGLFNWTLVPFIQFIEWHGKKAVNVGVCHIVRSILKIMDMFLHDMEKTNDKKIGHAWLQGLYVHACVWSIGGILHSDSMQKFNDFIKSLVKGNNEDAAPNNDVLPININFPEGLIYDYLFVFRGSNGAWKSWTDIVRNIKYDMIIKIGSLLIPTPETARYMYMIKLHVNHNNPMILIGPSGTGKTTYFRNYLIHELPTQSYWTQTLSMTMQMTANETQEIVLSQMFVSGKRLYKPPDGRKCVMFVDDVNVPSRDCYGDQTPIELLRQYLDHQHWFDLKESQPIYLSNILLLGAMRPEIGNQNGLSPRFLSHFNTYSVTLFTDASLSKIFRSILQTELTGRNFGPDIAGSIVAIVSATLKIYSDVKEYLLPTPLKCHYLFNLQNFSRVIIGCSLIHKESVDSRRVLIRLWVHEILREFYDRLIYTREKDWLIQKIGWCIKSLFKESLESVLENLGPLKGKKVHDTLRSLLFGSVLYPDMPFKSKKYEEMNFTRFQEVAENFLLEYNSVEKVKLDLTLFRYALEHLSRICRIMTMPGGNALLIGNAHVGKRSLARLGAGIIGHKFTEHPGNSSFQEWRNLLKKILKGAGGKSKPSVFLLSEMSLSKECLSDVAALLSCGEVPKMYSVEEKMELLEMVGRRAQGSRRTVNIDPLILYAFFVNSCKENLHIVMCISPTGPEFRNKLRCYPSFVNFCTLDLYEKWPEEAIERVAILRLGSLNLDENMKQSLVDAVVSFHLSTSFLGRLYFESTRGAVYFPSGSYFELLELCKSLIPQRFEEIAGKKQKFILGVEKLKSAAEMAVSMQKAVDEMQPELEKAQQKSIMMMETIEKESEAVEKASAMIKEDEIEANIKASAAQELKDDCEKDLAQVIPILEGAVKSLNTLKPADITLVKSMKNPPEAVKLVMAAVCVMLDVKPDRLNEDSSGKKITDYWGPSKKILSDMSFLQKLKEYDKHNIPPEIMAKIRKDYIRNPMFKPKKVKKASRAAEGLCKWVLAMSNFDEVEKIAAPKREKFEIADREYQETNRALEEKRAQIQALEAKISELKSSLEATDEHKKFLEEACRLSMIRLQRAERLIGGLSGEEERWLTAVKILEEANENALGDILLSSGFISYLPPFKRSLRDGCITYWKRLLKEKGIPFSKDYVFHKIMGDELQIQEWHLCGLPKDTVSVDNAVIACHSKRFSLIIDPQMLAHNWIVNLERKNGLNIVKVKDSNFQTVIETSMTRGTPVLLENFQGDISSYLSLVLKREFFESGGRWFMNIGPKIVSLNKDFRLYITSRESEIHFMPQVYAMVTIINFAICKEGLEDMLLGVATEMIKPQMEQEWKILVSLKEENKKQMKKLEDDVLTLLTSITGNILDSEPTVAALDSSKVLSSELHAEQEKLELSSSEIESERSSYRNVASYASKVYDSLEKLPSINPMYHFSLEWFVDVFKASLLASIQESVKLMSLEKLPKNFSYTYYRYVCRSIFNGDKLLFSFLLALSLVWSESGITAEELEYFAAGGSCSGFIPDNPAKSWLSAQSWENILRLCNLPSFKGFLANFKSNQSLWKILYQSNNSEKENIPSPWDKRLTSFQKLLLKRAFRADKVKSAIEEFIIKELGPKYLSAPGFNIAESFDLSKKSSPLLLMLSHGIDPVMDLVNFASSQDLHAELAIVPIGQDQGEVAENAIRYAQNKGSWVCLQNCHLAGSWMQNLENIVGSIPSDTSTEDGFRLWLTSYPCESFPQSVVQVSVKMVKETPSTLKRNLQQSFTSGPIAESSFYANYRDKDSILRRYMFSICFFHALIIERGKFGPIGWCETYNFDDTDLHISLKQMESLLTESDDTPHDSMRYLVGECNYGGRVTNDHDRHTLATILFDLISPEIEFEYYPSLTKTGPPFYLPVGGSYSDYIDFIKGLPEVFSPETFGLHENAGILREKEESKLILKNISLTILKSSDNECFNGSLLELIGRIENEVPRNFGTIDSLKEKPSEDKKLMDSILENEIGLYSRLALTVLSSLEKLKNSIMGMDWLTPDMEKMGASLLQGDIPLEWMCVSYSTTKTLGSYIADLKNRITYFQEWKANGPSTEFWLSGFFNPKSLVVSFLQEYSCEAKVPVSTVRLLGVSSQPEAKGSLCVYGLHMEGAGWMKTSSSIQEAEPGIPYYEMPKMSLIPFIVENNQEDGHFSCPIYNSPIRSKRTNSSPHSSVYVASVDLRTSVPHEHWIKRGAALLCQIDE